MLEKSKKINIKKFFDFFKSLKQIKADKNSVFLILLFVTVIAQVTLIDFFRIYNCKPDFVLIVISFYIVYFEINKSCFG